MPKLNVPKVKAKDLIKDSKWILFPGDVVRVIGGEKASEVGKEGKILDIVRKMNSVTINEVKMQKKHVRPNPLAPRGTTLMKPMPVHFSNVKLVDPHTQQLTDAKLIKKISKETGRLETYRLLKSSGQKLPVPADDGPVEKYEKSPLDTPNSLLAEKTWTPSVLNIPFPPRFMNQMERLKRMNSGGEF
ncbi:hypothetical protein HDU79_000648 [Rhizoclosmatium sp. JEL0117]|nr:hypothetical protein HDU79_000648 [Rhizoclosmatium sp. JEL0117]